MKFSSRELTELVWNPTVEFGKNWALVVAGTEESGFNAMTIAWCSVGCLFDRKGQRGIPTATVYIRPQRYTKEFIDREELFSIVTFPGKYKKQLAYMGAYSGRDVDKIKETGLTPVYADGFTYFEEAERVLVCRKIYRAPLTEDGFLDQRIVEYNYPKKDFHQMYIGEITRLLVPEQSESDPAVG